MTVHFFPLLGTGAKKGLSVSIKILSIGIDLKVSCKSMNFKSDDTTGEKKELKSLVF